MKKVPPVITGKWTDEGGGRKDGLPSQETSAPINSKKPKSRPPKTLRDKVGIVKSLPSYTGPYSVGTMEIEVPARNPCVVSNIKRKGHHLLQLETVLMVIYYPAKFGTGAGKPPSGQRNWSRETWLPKPRMQLAHGYGRFAGLGSLGIPFFATTSMLTKLHGFKNASPAEHWPAQQNLREGGKKVKHTAGPVPEGEPDEPTFPLLMFSHGLGGSRTMYSSLCGEFASYGFVVCAVEHRDGSCPRTFVNHPSTGEGSVEEREEKGHIDHNAKEKKRKVDVVDYVFPESNKYDTAPNNSKGVDHELRDAQIQLRVSEIEEAYHVLCEIAKGDGQRIAEKSLRGKGFAGGSSHGLIGIDWSAWKGRFHTSKAALVGHSFGAATVVTALRAPERFDWVACGIIYDIWGAAIKPYDPNIEEVEGRIQKPVLAINSEAFSYWPSNFTLVSSVINEARDADVPAWFLTLRGTVHVTQTDFALLYPHLCSILLKMTSDPRRALDVNINASLEFLKLISTKHAKEISLILRSTESEGILQTAITDDFRNLPQEELHPPNQKWIAARLKIPHEFTYRFSPSLARKRMRRKAQHGNRGLEGFGRPGEELWMHNAPTSEDLKRFGIPVENSNEGGQ